MTRKQAERFGYLCKVLSGYGLDADDVWRLVLCERALGRWDCRRCGDERGAVTVDDDGKAWWESAWGGRPYRIRNMGAAAERRAAKIAEEHGLTAYHQGDPRGSSLYILRPGDCKPGRENCEYTNGVAIYMKGGARWV